MTTPINVRHEVELDEPLLVKPPSYMSAYLNNAEFLPPTNKSVAFSQDANSFSSALPPLKHEVTAAEKNLYFQPSDTETSNVTSTKNINSEYSRRLETENESELSTPRPHFGKKTKHSALFHCCFGNPIARALRRAPPILDFLFTVGVLVLFWFGGGLALGLQYEDTRMPVTQLQPLQKQVLENIHIPPTILSIFGSLTIIFCYFYFASLRSFTMRLVLYLSISDLGLNISFIILYFVPKFCFIQAALSTLFPLASILWAFFIAFTLFQNLIKFKQVHQLQKFEFLMHAISWGIPTIFATIILALGWSEKQLSWCWIRSEQKSWRFLFFYLVLFLIFIYNFFMYITIIIFAVTSLRQLNQFTHTPEFKHSAMLQARKKTAKAALRFAYYLLAFMITWGPGLAHRIYNLINVEPNFWFILFHTISTPSQGLLNCLAYGACYQSKISKWLKTKCAGCCKKKNSSEVPAGSTNGDLRRCSSSLDNLGTSPDDSYSAASSARYYSADRL